MLGTPLRRATLILLTVATVMGLAVPAGACGCDSKPLSVLLEESDSVFTIRPAVPAPKGSRVTVEVERVYKGVVGPTADLAATEGPTACGVDWAGDGALPVLAMDSDEGSVIGTCRPQHSVADIEELLGPGYPPTAMIDLTTAGPSAGPYIALAGLVGTVTVAGLARRRRQRDDQV